MANISSMRRAVLFRFLLRRARQVWPGARGDEEKEVTRPCRNLLRRVEKTETGFPLGEGLCVSHNSF